MSLATGCDLLILKALVMKFRRFLPVYKCMDLIFWQCFPQKWFGFSMENTQEKVGKIENQIVELNHKIKKTDENIGKIQQTNKELTRNCFTGRI